MGYRLLIVAGLLSIGGAGAWAAGPTPGKWEMQTMGSDRDLDVKVRGNQIVIYRVLWPQFEGQKYKLEHLYKGTLAGAGIKGKLLVREEELPDYEELRGFEGNVISATKMKVDDTIMTLVGASGETAMAQANPPPATAPAPTAPPASGPPSSPAATSPATGSGQATTATANAAPPPAAGGEDPGVNLFDRILGSPGGSDLFHVSAKALMNPEGATYLEDGDRLYARQQWAAAAESYEKAYAAGIPVSKVAAKLAGAYIRLKDCPKAKNYATRALRLQPSDNQIKKLYKSYQTTCK